MLVVPCDVQDVVRIGDSVSVVVLEVFDDHVRLGVTSADQVPEYQEHTLYVAGAVSDEHSDDICELVGT
ncbi:MAG: carbon storage regulator [Planctomycetota bacterium]|nr:carbon storage regulator [Planctomycetaceae bacterium]MDQ3333140.1 carbon storage regulator [Planctomycetota bacterium]